MKIGCCLFVVGCVLSGFAWGSELEPETLWSFTAESNLYAPPLVADICPNPGLETVISDSEARLVKCIDAQGGLVWSYSGGWTKRLTSSAALSMTASADGPMLAVGNSDGTVCCLNAATGRECWKQSLGGIEWGGVLWADINGDGRDELVTGTETSGVTACHADGSVIWRYAGPDGKAPVIKCPLGASDVDGDGKAEVFAVGRFGPLCLDGKGALRWETNTADEWTSTVSIADANADGVAELYVCSANDDALWRLEPQTGAMVWRAGLAGKADVYPSACIAIADLDQDGLSEIVVGDQTGHVQCFRADGEPLWVFQARKPAHIAVTTGDVDGDGEPDVLAACGDHYLYGLDREGTVKWTFAAGMRLIQPPTIADINLDGKTEFLVGGSDKILRCLTMNGRYAPDLPAWPSRRFTPAQTGSSFVPSQARIEPPLVETTSLFHDGGFEVGKEQLNLPDAPQYAAIVAARAKEPRGWIRVDQTSTVFEMDASTCCEGKQSLKIIAGQAPFHFASTPIAIDHALRSLSVRISFNGAGEPSGLIRWRGTHGVLREDALTLSNEADTGWRILQADHLKPPFGAHWADLVCVSPVSTEPVWWDDARISGAKTLPKSVQALVNQVGYDVGAPKRFTVQSTFTASTATFEIADMNGQVVYNGTLTHEGRIQGAYGQDWGYEYWRGVFDAFDQPGQYRICAVLDGVRGESWPFSITPRRIWEATSRLAYQYFYYQRCGMAIPGFHDACHLDDATSVDHQRQYELWGGWHDAGDYNKYHNAPYVLGLSNAYAVCKAAFDAQDEDKNGVSDFLDEICWGGDHARRMIAPDGSAYGSITSGYGFWGPPERETDNQPGTGDERPVTGPETGNDPGQHSAALARIARWADDKRPWVEAADRALRWSLDHNSRGPLQFVTALELYLATSDEKYGVLAKELFPGPNVEVLDSIRLYDATFHEDHEAALRAALVQRADAMLHLARNPFGVYTFGSEEHPNYFNTPPAGSGDWHVGTSSYLLEAAWRMAQAYACDPKPEYLAFVYDQLNWTLGNNPLGICLMEGAGSACLPTYHHRYAFAGVPRGAVPGSVVNGVTWKTAGDDRPYLDLRGLDIPDFQPNESWLPHNTNYLRALAELYATKK